ncbi:AEC family transporter [Salinispirillum sp. LH 10-3-1]|uniref:AEC family transporter n=1 Tax=Salinispirillum sp. LH 10-3-1 TaxID=2952525 RepID=A0AB38YEP1_9GAMM
MTLLDNLLFSLSTTLPILLWLAGGHALKRTNRLSDAFIHDANRLVFTWCLPTLLFLNTARSSIVDSWQGDLIGYAAIFTLASIIVLWLITPLFTTDRSRRGVFVQGAYRGNMGIIGLAMVVNAFGTEVIPLASLYLAFITLIYNLAAIVVLQAGQTRLSPLKLVSQLFRNPLIIGVLLGLLWSITGWDLPGLANSTLQGLADLTLPVALICVGASLQFQSLRNNRYLVMIASGFKLIVIPVLAVGIAYLLGFRAEALGILFLMMASPTAAASFVMARAMTPWGELAAEIIVVTTFFSLLTTTLGLFMLRSLGWV